MNRICQELRPFLSVLLAATVTSGCAMSTILKRPHKKDLMVLNPGISRGAVIAELGNPAYTKDANGEKVDTFAFDKGVSGGYKFGRAFFHFAADFFTIFLWEIIGWPAERLASGNNTTVEVHYDNAEKVTSATYLKGGH